LKSGGGGGCGGCGGGDGVVVNMLTSPLAVVNVKTSSSFNKLNRFISCSCSD